MKNLYRLLFVLICPLVGWAQPTINASITPTIGDSWDVTFLETEIFEPGPSGANQHWDFGNVDISNSFQLIFEILDPADIVGVEHFPTADFVWHIPAFKIYNFYEIESDSISLVGGARISEEEIDFLTIYTDAENGLQLPLNYQDSYTYYSYFEQYIFGNFLAENDRLGTVTADGYGTITTPNGTYTNVLRVVVEETSFGFTNTQYAWYDVNNFVPIMVYELSEDPETPSSLYFSEPNAVNNTAEATLEDNSWQAWYNSDEHEIVANLSDLTNAESFSLGLADIQGRMIAKLPIRHNEVTDEITMRIPAGINHQILFLSLYNEQGISTKKVLVSRE